MFHLFLLHCRLCVATPVRHPLYMEGLAVASGRRAPMRMDSIDLLCVVLSGGKGRRLRPATSFVQKTMLPGRPGGRLIDAALHFCGQGKGALRTRPTIVLANYRADQVCQYLRANYAVSVHVEENQLGPPAAILQAWSAIRAYRPAHIAIVPGDHTIPGSVDALFETHRLSGADLTLAAVFSGSRVHDYLNFNATGRVISLSKYAERTSNLAFTGIAIVRTDDLWQHLTSTLLDGVHDLLPIYHELLATRRGGCFLIREGWGDLGTWPRYLRFLWRSRRRDQGDQDIMAPPTERPTTAHEDTANERVHH